MSLTWVFDGLKAEPYGLIPFSSLTGKGNTSVRYTKKLSSYNWLTRDDLEHPTIVVPGEPRQQKAFGGCKMQPDTEDLIFDPNIIGLPRASMDPLFEVLRMTQRQPIDFQGYDVATDVINLQKLFAFCKGEEDGGLFRIDAERVGKLIILNRIEGSGLIPADPDFPTYDITLQKRVCRERSNVTDGPFHQISSYQFGAFNLLVRYQPEFAEFSPNDWLVDPEEVNEDFAKNSTAFPDSNLHYVKYGKKYDCGLSLISSYPEGPGFPNFLWPGVFFSGVDRMLVGYFKGTGEFGKPASYTLADMNRLVKPLPYQTATRMHDLLSKLINFMRGCEKDAKITLIWQGFPHIEIYERAPATPAAISTNVRKFLESQYADDEPEDSPDSEPELEMPVVEDHEMNDVDHGDPVEVEEPVVNQVGAVDFAEPAADGAQPHVRFEEVLDAPEQEDGGVVEQDVPPDPEHAVDPPAEDHNEEQEETIQLDAPVAEEAMEQDPVPADPSPGEAEERRSPPADAEERKSPPDEPDGTKSHPEAEARKSPPAEADERKPPPAAAEERKSPPIEPEARKAPPAEADEAKSPPKPTERKSSPTEAGEATSPPTEPADRKSPPAEADEVKSHLAGAEGRKTPPTEREEAEALSPEGDDVEELSDPGDFEDDDEPEGEDHPAIASTDAPARSSPDELDRVD